MAEYTKEDLARDKLRNVVNKWDKPLSPPRPVPKSVPKKRGRPAKEQPDSD